MTLPKSETDLIAKRLFEAYSEGQAATPPTKTFDLTTEDAYCIQSAVLDHRDSPEIGYKLGFTNDRIQTQMGVDRPASGRLLADSVLEGNSVDTTSLIDPRFEPEIGFVLDELSSPAFAYDVLGATRAVVPAVEIVDSRTGDWSLSPEDAIADNALASRVLIGARSVSVDGLDLSMEAVQVRKNSELVETGIGANVLSHPVNAVRWLADRDGIEAGSLVLTGSLTPALALEPGDTVEIEFSTLGTVSLRAD